MLSYDRQLLLLRFLRLGMDFQTACLASEITEEEEDELLDDENFQRQAKIQGAMLESELLMRHNSASEIAEARGGTSAIQWKLERINKARYSTKDSGETPFSGKVVINVIRGKKENY